jgi:hypothetical protein
VAGGFQEEVWREKEGYLQIIMKDEIRKQIFIAVKIVAFMTIIAIPNKQDIFGV